MSGNKTSSDREVSGPQHATTEADPSPASKAHSIPTQLAIGNRAVGELLQSKIKVREVSAAKTDTNSGGQGNALPQGLKGSLESLSGLDLSDVRVHRNSSKPDELNALAYTQGRDIHLGPGQDEHLPHEAWHAVQQMQGRVKPTMNARGVSLNDDAHLEREADQMAPKITHGVSAAAAGPSRAKGKAGGKGVAQRKIKITGLTEKKRKHFVTKINDGSKLEYQLDASGYLEQKDKKKTATDEYSKQILAAIADGQDIILNLVSKDDARFIDSFAGGQVDYDDMKDLAFNLFRSWFLHFVVERFAIPNYEANKATASDADFAAAHKKGHEAQERQMKTWFPKKTIKYIGEGFDAASKKVDKAGNGSINYEFDFTDVKHVFKQPIVANVTQENIISAKIIVVR